MNFKTFLRNNIFYIFFILTFFDVIYIVHEYWEFYRISENISKVVLTRNNYDDIVNTYQSIFHDLKSLTIYRNQEVIFFKKNEILDYHFDIKFRRKFNLQNQELNLIFVFSFLLRDFGWFNLFSIILISIFFISINTYLSKILQHKKKRQTDYFLLFQLYDSLKVFSIHSENIEYQYIVQQFTKFVFKNTILTLGGDYIYLDKIELRNRSYVFFINADAMGKSLKGLLGILVLASVLIAILRRTQKRKIEKQRFPDTWLKYVYLEIQEVLETFNGSMLISAVIGLIDERNYCMYYINLDHPRIILQRGNEYQFIESKIYQKLGFPGSTEVIEIHRLFLNKSDSIYVGSDGKDEVLINGQVNQNENLSLELLRQTEGDIKKFYKSLKSNFEFQDDFSMLKITIKKESEESQALVSKDEVEKKAFRLYKEKRYNEIVDNFHHYAHEYPVSDNILYFYSVSCRKLNRIEEEIEIGERLWNFNKSHIKNFIRLLYCYQNLKNQERVESLIEEFIKFHKNESMIQKIQKRLKLKLKA
ncbi:MAG: serine/threonine-protein phosphatase [Leptospiraceae bacterium]|nr:serine/threonine-protein phosphatase [Leptospiraceae bacterium]MDW7975876.1 SpoIIE family protein phosphatase [Leptospiraceae bacterium]